MWATVYLSGVPEGADREVDALYSSLFSTVDYFSTYDDAQPTGAVVLAAPRHILLFAAEGDTIEVLNKAIVMAPEDARRACLALFRAVPGARRIHLEVMFPPRLLGLARRELYTADDMVVSLPASLEDYLAGLGQSTRQNLRRYQNRLRRAYPDLSTAVLPPEPERDDRFDLYLEWKRRRLQSQGETLYFDRLPDRIPRFRELLRRRGEIHLTSVGERIVAIVYTFPVGQACYAYQYAYDPDLDYYHLGLLSQYWVVADSLARGMRRVNFLWGTTYYKERLGARPVRAARLSVFRSQPARLYSLGEAWEVQARRLRKSRDLYWRARGAAGKRAREWRERALTTRARRDKD